MGSSESKPVHHTGPEDAGETVVDEDHETREQREARVAEYQAERDAAEAEARAQREAEQQPPAQSARKAEWVTWAQRNFPSRNVDDSWTVDALQKLADETPENPDARGGPSFAAGGIVGGTSPQA